MVSRSSTPTSATTEAPCSPVNKQPKSPGRWECKQASTVVVDFTVSNRFASRGSRRQQGRKTLFKSVTCTPILLPCQKLGGPGGTRWARWNKVSPVEQGQQPAPGQRAMGIAPSLGRADRQQWRRSVEGEDSADLAGEKRKSGPGGTGRSRTVVLMTRKCNQ